MNYQEISRRFHVNTSDPDISRRASLLNLLLIGLITCCIVVLFVTILIVPFASDELGRFISFVLPASISLGLFILIFIVNIKFSPTLASILCLAFITIFPLFFVPIEEIIWGWPSLFMVSPVIIGSVILWPRSSFIMAMLITIMLLAVSIQINIQFNFLSCIAYFVIAFIAWLSASTLENTLKELRIINRELDLRVAQRTKELVLANKELSQARDKAIEASQYKSELTARVSHELRTPLGAILGFAEMLRGNFYGVTTEKQREKLTTIINTTKQLSSLIGDWLDQAKLEAGKLELVLDKFSVGELVAEVDDVARILADQKNLSLTFSIQEGVPKEIYGDVGRLHQILINLVSNAIKYTKEGWIRVTISVPNTKNLVLEVKDSGIGIPLDAQPFIFESFNQVDSSRTRQQEGFGLGLSIVKQLVDLMDGEIYLDSKPNIGSKFTIVLPLLTERTDIQEQQEDRKEFVV